MITVGSILVLASIGLIVILGLFSAKNKDFNPLGLIGLLLLIIFIGAVWLIVGIGLKLFY